MSSARITLLDRQAGAKLRVGQRRQFRRVHAAQGATARQAAAEIKQRGDADIRAGGNFGSRWTEGFHSTTLLRGVDYTVRTSHDISYFPVFEFGATIHGKPLLWIPLSFAQDAQGIMARDYPGGLFRVDRKRGAPLLLAIRSREPKYFGKALVRIPKKFHIREICRDVARRLRDFYRRNLRSQTGG